MTAGFLQIKLPEREREQRRKCRAFSLGSDMPYFCHILLVTQTNPDTLWEGTIQRCEYQEVGDSSGAILKLATICLC